MNMVQAWCKDGSFLEKCGDKYILEALMQKHARTEVVKLLFENIFKHTIPAGTPMETLRYLRSLLE